MPFSAYGVVGCRTRRRARRGSAAGAGGPGGSRGPDASLVASADVPGGTPVLFVPAALILSSDQAIAELRGPGMADAERFVRERGGARRSTGGGT